MIPVLPPSAIAQELTACTVLGGCTGVVRAVFPVRGRAAWVPDFLWVGTVLTLLQSYAAGQSPAGVLRWYMAAAGFAGAGAAAFVLGVVVAGTTDHTTGMGLSGIKITIHLFGGSLDIENYCTLRLIFVQPIINGALVPQLHKAAVCQIQNPVCRGYGFRAMGYQQDRKPQLT